jgi:hypothetical protein
MTRQSKNLKCWFGAQSRKSTQNGIQNPRNALFVERLAEHQDFAGNAGELFQTMQY